MAVPHYTVLFTPLLRHLEDGIERSAIETHDALAREFGLSETELEMPSPGVSEHPNAATTEQLKSGHGE